MGAGKCVVACVMSVALSSLPASANDSLVDADAVALVKRGLAYLRAQGRDRGFAEIINKQGQFTQRDLYLVVYGMDGTVYAHGANERLVGRNLLDMRDIDGHLVIRERVELARTRASFWQEYKYTNPISKRIEPKHTYCERLDDLIVCGGVYLH